MEEGDGEWGHGFEKDNLEQQTLEKSIPKFTQACSENWNKRYCNADLANILGVIDDNISNSNGLEGNVNALNNYGHEKEELDWLNLDERKRRRCEARGFIATGINKDTSSMEYILSTIDCT